MITMEGLDGRYDAECKELYERLRPNAVLMIVIGGPRGHGFSYSRGAEYSIDLPMLLRVLSEEVAKREHAAADVYLERVRTFATAWRDAMTVAAEHGETIAECAERLALEHRPDVTLGMVLGAVLLIAGDLWVHGPALGAWYNSSDLRRNLDDGPSRGLADFVACRRSAT